MLFSVPTIIDTLVRRMYHQRRPRTVVIAIGHETESAAVQQRPQPQPQPQLPPRIPTASTATACMDTQEQDWCQKKLESNKCDKSHVAQLCELTCKNCSTALSALPTSPQQQQLQPPSEACSHARPPPRVAIIYSGRWWSDPSKFVNHRERLWQPNNAEIFLTVTAPTWCDATVQMRQAYRAKRFDELSALLQEQVRSAFGYSRVRAVLTAETPSREPDGCIANARARLKGENIMVNGSYMWGLVYSWVLQMNHLGSAEQLRQEHGPHDVVVRIRMDGQLVAPLHFAWDSSGRCQPGPEPRSPLVVMQTSMRTFSATRQHDVVCNMTDNRDTGRTKPVECRRVPRLAMRPAQLRAVFGGSEVLMLGRHVMRNTSDKPGYDMSAWWECAKAGDAELFDQYGKGVDRSCPIDDNRFELRWMWFDWLYVGTPRGISPLVNLARNRSMLLDLDARCWGLCQEEQTAMRLQAAGTKLVRLAMPFQLLRDKCQNPTQPKCLYVHRKCAIPLINRDELMTDFRFPPFRSACALPTAEQAKMCDHNDFFPRRPPPPPPPPLPPLPPLPPPAPRQSWTYAGSVVAGVCGVTQDGAPNRCGRDSSGAWTLKTLDECVLACAACSNCRFLSFSSKSHDCSWHSSCEWLDRSSLSPLHLRLSKAYVTLNVSLIEFAGPPPQTRVE